MSALQHILAGARSAGAENNVTLSQLIELTNAIRATTADKISGIQKVTGLLRMLALNAMIESARAGTHGRGFSVVAAEVREIANSVGLFSEQLQKELASQIDTLSDRTRSMANAAIGSRMVDLALNAIEIIDRNLYERTCDVRWWATDSAVVAALAEPGAASASHASKRLKVILDAYTVYLDLWICDASGRVIASGRPERYRAAVGASVATTPWFREALRTRSGDEFAVCDIERAQALGGAPVATYATAIREGGQSHGRPIGVLGVHFDWAPQAQAVVDGVRLSEQERDRTRVLLLDQNRRVLAASDGQGVLSETIPLEADGGFGSYQSGAQTIGFALTPGYETYRGLGWYGCLIQSAVAKSHLTPMPAWAAA